MLDIRPVGYVIGLLVAALGVTMTFPLLFDLVQGNGHWPAFLQSAIITVTVGTLMALACANGVTSRLSIQQTFLLTTGVWLALPIFGAIPFVMGATDLAYVDAFFEAMSGLTTTGSTVLSGLESLPRGILFWRGMLQWFGGIGIIVVAMVFLPELRVGGMQIFRSEGFDTVGKILPRATEIASRISVVYFALTIACAFTYIGFGMTPFDAATHAMTTLATGGFANYDASFAAFGPGVVCSWGRTIPFSNSSRRRETISPVLARCRPRSRNSSSTRYMAGLGSGVRTPSLCHCSQRRAVLLYRLLASVSSGRAGGSSRRTALWGLRSSRARCWDGEITS